MQYYNEEHMHEIQMKLEQEILSWPDVSTKKMYGCPCYKYKNKLFAFLITDGVVLTKANEQDKQTLSHQFDIQPFKAANRTMKNWPHIPLDDTVDLHAVVSFIKNSYTNATTMK